MDRTFKNIAQFNIRPAIIWPMLQVMTQKEMNRKRLRSWDNKERKSLIPTKKEKESNQEKDTLDSDAYTSFGEEKRNT